MMRLLAALMTCSMTLFEQSAPSLVLFTPLPSSHHQKTFTTINNQLSRSKHQNDGDLHENDMSSGFQIKINAMPFVDTHTRQMVTMIIHARMRDRESDAFKIRVSEEQVSYCCCHLFLSHFEISLSHSFPFTFKINSRNITFIEMNEIREFK